MTTTAIDLPPSISERYGVAIGVGVQSDIVLAAGLQRSLTGALLIRLQAEYDMVRADMEKAGQIMPRRVDRANNLDAAAKAWDDDAAEAVDVALAGIYRRKAEAAREEAAAIRRRLPAEIVSARAFVLLELKTLRPAKERIAALAIRMAQKRKIEPEAALKLAGRVLDVYLDPMCHHCDGTGKVGNVYAGEAERECRACRGTGTRRDVIGNGPAETTFAAVLMGELQRQASDAARGMRDALRGSDQSAADAAVLATIRQSLGELRSAAAAVD